MSTEPEQNRKFMSQIRSLVNMLPSNNEDDMSYAETRMILTARSATDLADCIEDPALMLPRISDDSAYFEVKPLLRKRYGYGIHQA
jgi:hypothetical protein